MKVLKQDVTIAFRHYGNITIPAGTPTTHQTATGIDEKMNFVNSFGWIDEKYPDIANILKMDAESYGINIPAEYIVYNNGKYLKGLSLPVRYEGGVIVDGMGKEIISANRISGETPLMPAGRDALLMLVAVLLNEAFECDKASIILRKLDY